MQNSILIGGGGLASEVYSLFRILNEDINFIGYCSNEKSINRSLKDLKYLGEFEDFKYNKNHTVIICIGDTYRKKIAFEFFKSNKIKISGLIHPSSIIANDAKVHKSAIIFPFAIVSASAVVKEGTLLNMFTCVGHNAICGKYTTLSPYSFLAGFAELGNGVYLAAYAMLTAYVKVGSYSIVSAKSVVKKDFKKYSIIYGNPAKGRVILSNPKKNFNKYLSFSSANKLIKKN